MNTSGNAPEKRRILFLLRSAPYGDCKSWEMLDATLVAGIFELEVAVLLLADAVTLLLPDQDASLLGQRDPGKALAALPDYDIKQLYVSATALAERGLAAAKLRQPAMALDAPAIQALLANQDLVLCG